MKLVWSRRSIKDLVSIGDYIAKNNPSEARLHIERLRSCARRLIQFPQSGRKVPECSHEFIREIIFEKYRIVYEVEKKQITILTIFEGHRLLRI